MVLHPTQKQIAIDLHRFRVLVCGRRWGKTTEAVEEILHKGIAKGDQRIVYVAPTIGQARDLVWSAMTNRYRPIFAREPNESRLEIYIKTVDGGTTTIYLKGWEAIERLRGWKIDFIVLDEVRDMVDFWLYWQEVIRPALTDVRGEGLFMTTPNGFDHCYDLFNMELKNPDFKSFRFTSYDNPFMPKDEIDAAKRELPDDRFAQEYLAEFRKKQGLVYPEFDRTKHLFDDANKYNVVEVIAGVDFGFTNPAVILVIDKDSQGNYWLREEWYKRGKTNQELIEVAKSFRANIFYPDPAEPDRIEEMNRAGLNVHEVSKDVEKGIDSVRSLLKTGRLRIHKNCIMTINEFETYSYKDKKPNQNTPEEPIKEKDHAMDALRYALHMNAPVAVDFGQEDFNLYGHSYS